jgi:hypothetical protein
MHSMLSLVCLWLLPFIPSAAHNPATDSAIILAIAPSSSIAPAQFLETAVQGRSPHEINLNGWPGFGIAVSFWRGCSRSDAI